jgi:hypothetical protein
MPSAVPAANEPQSLFGQIADYIAQAKDVRTLGKIADRIEQLASEGQLTHDQVADLTVEIDRRDSVIIKKETTDAL